MQTDLAQALRARRPQIRARWLELLFVEPVNTPLANPRSLIFLLDETIDAVLASLRRSSGRRAPAAECPCGRNPYLSYFRAGRQAMFEALVLLQSEEPALDPRQRDQAVADLSGALGRVAAEMIEAFGSLCLHRGAAAGGCDHPDCDRVDANEFEAGCTEEQDARSLSDLRSPVLTTLRMSSASDQTSPTNS